VAERVVTYIERLASFIARHWLLAVNSAMFLFIFPAFLAPYLMAIGIEGPAKFIYMLYHLTCHQLPERSFFVFGHKMALCARCSSLYLSFWGVGLFYGLWRSTPLSRRYHLSPLSLKLLFLLALPMAIDGTGQLLGLWESTNTLRAITGALAGGGFGLFAYPLLDQGFQSTILRTPGQGTVIVRRAEKRS